MFWLLCALAVMAVLVMLVVGRLESGSDHMPRDFDFDHYKTRELNQRGLFDKTKWR